MVGQADQPVPCRCRQLPTLNYQLSTALTRIFSLAFFTGFSGAMMPGPLLALTIGQVAASGFMAAMWLITGHALLELLLLLFLVLGLRVVLARPKIRGGIGLIGGVALLYMGLDMVRSAAALQLGQADAASPLNQGEAMSAPMLLLAGAAVSLANPYFTGWWATIGVGQLAHTGPQTRREYLAFYLGHELSDYVWYAFVAVLIVGAREWLAGAWYNWLVGSCGAAVAALALWFLYNGIRLLRPAGK